MRTTLLENELLKLELDGGIIIVTWKIIHVDLESAKKIVEQRKKATANQEYPMMANISSVKTSLKDARDFLASEDGCSGIKAAALIIDSPIGSMIGNFWIRINKPLRPTKLFTDEREAKKWLVNYVKQ